MSDVDIARNLLANQMCDNCLYLGDEGFHKRSTYEMQSGKYCVLEEHTKHCPEENFCEKWRERNLDGTGFYRFFQSGMGQPTKNGEPGQLYFSVGDQQIYIFTESGWTRIVSS